MKRFKSIQQAEKIRDKVLEVLLEQAEVPLPETIVKAEVDERCTRRSTVSTTTRPGSRRLLEEQGSSREEFDADARSSAEKAVKTQLLLDAIADDPTSRSARTSSPSAWC